MKKLNELAPYQIKRLIEERMETLADMTGYTPTSITKITGWSDETTAHETLRKILKTVRMDGVTKEDMINTYECLGRVCEAWEAKGY